MLYLKAKDSCLIIAVFGGFFLMAFAARTAAVAVIGAALIALVLECYRRLQAQQRDDYRQIEALFSLFAAVPIQRPLPPMRDWAISPDFANVLVGLIYERKPRLILELGGGVSTLIAGYALRRAGGGAIVSLEHQADHAQQLRRRVQEHGLEDIVSVILAPLKAVEAAGRSWLWYEMSSFSGLKDIDLVVVDGPPASTQALARYPALPILLGHLSQEAVVVLDDAARADEREAVRRWLSEFGDFESSRLDTEKGTVVLRRKTEMHSKSGVAA